MQKFIRTIKLDDTLTDLFLSSLLSEKYQVPALSKEQEDLISYISDRFLISGFLLKSCYFNLSNISLVEKLKNQRRIQLLKQMSVKNDLNNIACTLNEKGIDHVFLKGSALNADGFYASGIRFSRDIDLLVRLDSLDEAYNVLKSLGFKYLNPETQDSTKYYHFKHHLPEMINENNTKLELHWRVSHLNKFKNCPFTEKMLDSSRVSNMNPNIFCPKIEITIAHLIHHSFEHHRMKLGPIFLFDLAAIFVFFGKKWPVDHDLFERLGIAKKFELCEKFIERASNELRLSDESKLLYKQIFKNSHWLTLSDGSIISDSLVKTARIEISDNPNFVSRLLLKVRSIKTSYQVSYYSVKFWVILVPDILSRLKKVSPRHLFFLAKRFRG